MTKVKMEEKKVLIVVVTYNGADYIGDCLSSLALTTYSEDTFQVMVIDNASTDTTVASVKTHFPDVVLLEQKENLGFAKANNIGMRYGIDHGFKYVYLLNQDTVVEPSFLAEAVALAESNANIAAVQSKLLLFEDKTKINSIGNEIHYLGFGFAGGHKTVDRPLEQKQITYASGAAVLLRTSALQSVGLFNEDFFMYHEDTDLGWRLWLAGYRVMLAPASVIYHKYQFSRSIKKFYYMERNRYLTILQNYDFKTLLLILPALALMDCAMFFYSFFAGWWRENLKVFSFFCKLSTWQQIQKTRQQVQGTRKLSDREVVEKFVGRIEFQDLSNPLLTYIANPIFDTYWKVVRNFIRW